MGRWSPTVERQAPRLAPMFDIGGALGALADGITDVKQGRERRRLEEKADARYTDARGTQLADKALAQDRQATEDAERATDRTLQRESNYLTTRGRARDEGYVPGAEAQGRRAGYGALQGNRASGDMDSQTFAGIGDALMAASDGAPSMALTRPDGGRDDLTFDPTQTREVRDDQRAISRQRTLDAMRPKAPVRDPVADDIATYTGKQEYDRKYRVGDFKPERATGGGGSRGANDPRIGMANTQFDNAMGVVRNVQGEEPRAPTFDKFQGGERPLEGEPSYPSFRTDSIAKANTYQTQKAGWEKRLNGAMKSAEKWQGIGEALAAEAVGARGGDAVFTQQQINAQREIAQASAELNATLAQVRNDPIAVKELREQFTRDVEQINSKYGIRPKPEE